MGQIGYPRELPSPFPYAAYRAIDKGLRMLEITNDADVLASLVELKETLPSLNEDRDMPSKQAARERLRWTIGELRHRVVQESDTLDNDPREPEQM